MIINTSNIAELSAWLKLSSCVGLSRTLQRKLLRVFGSPEAIFQAKPYQLQQVDPKAIRVLEEQDPQKMDQALTWLSHPEHHLITLADEQYPTSLLSTADPPTVLYVIGQLTLWQRPMLAIVGARQATPQGKEIASDFAQALSKQGIIVVSGLAQGIDSAAHHGTLQGNGSTIAVIGTGADRVYPASNRNLAHMIAEQGAIISEFPLGTPPMKANFPRRNRIIAGLSAGVLVVEASIQSGSLITARLAGENGREVFAIPGSIYSPLSKGTHQLIRQGAKLVETVDDIVQELSWHKAGAPLSTEITQIDNNDLIEQDLMLVFEAMGYEPCDIDTLVKRTEKGVAQISSFLLSLELKGKIRRLVGGFFQRKQ